MNHYQCKLIDADTDKALDLGIFAAKTAEQAKDKAEARFKNMLRTMATGKWSMTVTLTADPLPEHTYGRRNAGFKLKDTTRDMWPVEVKS